jgi:hypothetical protein
MPASGARKGAGEIAGIHVAPRAIPEVPQRGRGGVPTTLEWPPCRRFYESGSTPVGHVRPEAPFGFSGGRVSVP